MVQRFKTQSNERISLAEFCLRCDEKLKDNNLPLSSLAEDLAAVARNKKHLASLICELLSEKLTSPNFSMRYSDQCQVLARRPEYIVRMAAWDVPRVRGGSSRYDEDYLSYRFVHNHNFDLLTAGVYGPGYKSLNWHLDMPIQHFETDESVNLIKLPDEVLEDGDVLFFKSWHNVHAQLPPTSFSMSLNLIIANPLVPQFSFDSARSVAIKQIGGIGSGLAGLLSIASAMNHSELDDLILNAHQELVKLTNRNLIFS